MARASTEIETKFDIAPDFAVPDLVRFAGDGGRVEDDVVELSSTYHDTSDRDLLRFRLTLRRREGDVDTGWQLKVPGRGERTELHWPLGDAADGLPAEAVELLAPFLRGRPVAPAVRLDVRRQRHRIFDADDQLLAEVAQDDVRAVDVGAPVKTPRWHEVEVELGTGSLALQADIGEAILQAGAYPSTSATKFGRALLGIGNEGIGTARSSAGAVLVDYIGQQCNAIVAGHFGIPREADDSVHQTRVGCRRIRSTLRTFEHCFDVDQANVLEDELKWYATVLGEVRDRDVLRRRIGAAVRELPEDLVVGPVSEHIDTILAGEQAARRADLLSTMRGERYANLLGEVTRWRDDPPFTAAADQPANTLQDPVDRMQRKLAKRLDVATDHGGTDEDMHRARKTGKRLRYAAEAAANDTKRALVKQTTSLQDLLGEFQDSVVAQDLLRRLASDAWSRGEDGFTYGVLVSEERRRADEVRRLARKNR
ncbi:MAG: CYTH and CHAD domain-containing protein [Actinomycetota bacterium]